MKATTKLLAGVGLLAIAGFIIYTSRRRKSNRVKEYTSRQVAEHGYETAHDILFPQKKKGNPY